MFDRRVTRGAASPTDLYIEKVRRLFSVFAAAFRQFEGRGELFQPALPLQPLRGRFKMPRIKLLKREVIADF